MKNKYWAVIPAGGSGSRMGAEKPKQYLTIAGKSVIEHTLERLLHHPAIAGACVAVAENDSLWAATKINTNKTLITAPGGQERCHSVVNALEALQAVAGPDDWVLVHDAARPCIRRQDIDKLVNELGHHSVGGILAVPVHDTIKLGSSSGEIQQTIDRSRLWHAQTPQMFRLQMLRDALAKAIAEDFIVTDEASAMEHAGLNPLLIEGHADNIKITRPEDLQLADFYLKKLANTHS